MPLVKTERVLSLPAAPEQAQAHEDLGVGELLAVDLGVHEHV